jgi:hypothetical protein
MGGFADSLNSDSLMRVKKQGNMPNPGNEKREEINNGSDNR